MSLVWCAEWVIWRMVSFFWFLYLKRVHYQAIIRILFLSGHTRGNMKCLNYQNIKWLGKISIQDSNSFQKQQPCLFCSTKCCLNSFTTRMTRNFCKFTQSHQKNTSHAIKTIQYLPKKELRFLRRFLSGETLTLHCNYIEVLNTEIHAFENSEFLNISNWGLQKTKPFQDNYWRVTRVNIRKFKETKIQL